MQLPLCSGLDGTYSEVKAEREKEVQRELFMGQGKRMAHCRLSLFGVIFCVLRCFVVLVFQLSWVLNYHSPNLVSLNKPNRMEVLPIGQTFFFFILMIY